VSSPSCIPNPTTNCCTTNTDTVAAKSEEDNIVGHWSLHSVQALVGLLMTLLLTIHYLMPDQALDVFRRMNEIFGCCPGIRSYNSLLNAFVKCNQWDRAESFFAYFVF
ncbi:Pentatricopeptide repeat-containing protein, partial [Thalictrum thalictroides]